MTRTFSRGWTAVPVGAAIAASMVLLTPGTAFAAGEPLAPLALVATDSLVGSTMIALQWEPGTYNQTDPLYPDGYLVERCAGMGCTDFVEVSQPTFAFTVDEVPLESTTYSFRVRAFNEVGVSPYSAVATATSHFRRPGQASDLQAAYGPAGVGLTWVNNDDLLAPQTEIRVERAEVGVSTEFEVVAVLPPDATSFTDAGALGGTAYDYRIRTYRYAAFAGTTDARVATGSGLAAPSGLRAGSTRTAVQLSWRNPTQLSQTHVWRCDGDCANGAWAPVAVLAARSQRYVDTAVERGTLYSYRIRSLESGVVSPMVYVMVTTR